MKVKNVKKGIMAAVKWTASGDKNLGLNEGDIVTIMEDRRWNPCCSLEDGRSFVLLAEQLRKVKHVRVDVILDISSPEDSHLYCKAIDSVFSIDNPPEFMRTEHENDYINYLKDEILKQIDPKFFENIHASYALAEIVVDKFQLDDLGRCALSECVDGYK